jgi:hypothetical protein
MGSNHHCCLRETVLSDIGIKPKLGHQVYLADAPDGQPVSQAPQGGKMRQQWTQEGGIAASGAKAEVAEQPACLEYRLWNILWSILVIGRSALNISGYLRWSRRLKQTKGASSENYQGHRCGCQKSGQPTTY